MNWPRHLFFIFTEADYLFVPTVELIDVLKICRDEVISLPAVKRNRLHLVRVVVLGIFLFLRDPI